MARPNKRQLYTPATIRITNASGVARRNEANAKCNKEKDPEEGEQNKQKNLGLNLKAWMPSRNLMQKLVRLLATTTCH
jgi:hypothetical protein